MSYQFLQKVRIMVMHHFYKVYFDIMTKWFQLLNHFFDQL